MKTPKNKPKVRAKGPRTSVIIHPPELPLMIIREDYKVICCGDSCSAALLNVFEHWANSLGKETWMFRSMAGLQEDLIHEYGDTLIKRGLKNLREWGYIERRNNPDKGFDRTYQYRLIASAIHFAIRYFYPMDEVNLPNALGKSTQAIQETLEETKEKPSPAGDGGPSEKQLHSWRVRKLATVMASYRNGWREPTDRNIGYWQGKNSKGAIGKLAAEVEDLTPENFEQFLREWQAENPDSKPLGAYDTLLKNILEWIDYRGGILAPRETERWQQNNEMFEAFLAAHSDRYQPAELLELDFKGIEMWYYKNGEHDK